MLGSVAFMSANAKQAEKIAALDDSRIEILMDQHFAPAIDKSVKRYAKTVVDDLQHELKTWKAAAGAKPSGRSARAKAKTRRAAKTKAKSAK
jgi:hypothetical protein